MAFRLETKPNPCRRTSSGRIGQGASRSGCGPCRCRRPRRRRAGAPALRDEPRILPRRKQIGRADRARRIGVAAPFDPERRAAVAVPAAGIRPLGAWHAERQHETPAQRQAFDPAIGRPRHGKTDVNPVGRGFRQRAPSSQMTRTFGRPERALARLASAASNSTAVTWPAGSTSSAGIAL